MIGVRCFCCLILIVRVDFWWCLDCCFLYVVVCGMNIWSECIEIVVGVVCFSWVMVCVVGDVLRWGSVILGW